MGPAVDLAAMRPCFIGGMARSGTSLLKSLLDGHPQVMQFPGESFAIDWYDAQDPVHTYLRVSNFTKFHPEGSEGYAAMERELGRRLNGPTDLRRGLLALYEAAAALWPPPPGATLWVEKTPRHVRVFPALLAAFRLQERAAAVGFDFPDLDTNLAKVDEELAEVRASLHDPGERAAEIGDLLFAVANVGRALKTDPEVALRGANQRFVSRFRYIEQSLASRGLNPEDVSLDELDSLWDEAKAADASAANGAGVPDEE